jgi:DNA-binding transcriptional LysR family regulator
MEVFIRVVDAGSFSGAAIQLRVGQPAVSKTIAQLEVRLGVRLLLRSDARSEANRGGPKLLRTRQAFDRRSRGSRTRRARRRSVAYGPTADFCAGDVRAASIK